MTTTVSIYDFRNWFMSSATYKNAFSEEGIDALFDYLEEYEDSTGQTIDFDPVALCVEYTEYSDLKEIQANYSDIKSLEDLEDHTQVIQFEGGIIIQDF